MDQYKNALTERQKRIMRDSGMDISKIESFSERFLELMSDGGVRINEAKAIAERLTWALEEVEKHRPDTPLRKVLERT